MVHKAMDQVAAVFEAHDRPHPFKSSLNKLDFEVKMLLKEYKNKDPPEKHEVAVTPNFLYECYNRSSTKKEKHMSVLLIIAFFCAMRSREYLVTSAPKVTANIRLKHAVFLNSRGGVIPQRSLQIHEAYSTSLIFEDQKNRAKWDKSTQESTHDPLLNPTRALASLVDELWNHPNTTPDTQAC